MCARSVVLCLASPLEWVMQVQHAGVPYTYALQAIKANISFADCIAVLHAATHTHTHARTHNKQV